MDIYPLKLAIEQAVQTGLVFGGCVLAVVMMLMVASRVTR